MRFLKTYLFFSVFLFSVYATAQTLPLPRNIKKAFDKGSRSSDGRPGKNYWQNSADYAIDVSFDPATRLVAGKVHIVYKNNSPDTLKEIWFKLYPNLYKTGTPRINPIAAEDSGEGLIIDSMRMDGKNLDTATLNINGTNMILDDVLLAHGSSADFTVAYHYKLNKGSHIRTGEVEPGAAFVAYFFPRIAVYDDIDGWNKHPYNGLQEFYNDFCRFDARITVPKNFVVWATGDLKNATEVLNARYCQRISQAEKSDTVVTIFDSTDNGDDITANHAFNTWHFSAEGVSDFVFATSNHYTWMSTSLVVDPVTKRRTRVDAVFNPVHRDYFDVVHDARKTVAAMSYTFPHWPFPYAHETVFDGLDQMEYPMMVNDNPVADRAESIELTDHEIFHTMFPFYMGINETKYAWMDEGWATIGEWLISPMIDSTLVDEYGVAPYAMNADMEADLPIMTLSTQINGTTYFLNSYPKPAFGYLYIKDMLGEALFTKALHHYIRQWQGKHPVPYDFFNCMNAGSGKNLNWFWKRWFFDSGFPDLGIATATKKGNSYLVTINLKGSKPLPVDLTIEYRDGSSGKIHRTVSVWEKGNSKLVLTIPVSKQVKSFRLGSTYVPDVDPSDNVFMVK